jgi:hypothetical protein
MSWSALFCWRPDAQAVYVCGWLVCGNTRNLILSGPFQAVCLQTLHSQARMSLHAALSQYHNTKIRNHSVILSAKLEVNGVHCFVGLRTYLQERTFNRDVCQSTEYIEFYRDAIIQSPQYLGFGNFYGCLRDEHAYFQSLISHFGLDWCTCRAMFTRLEVDQQRNARKHWQVSASTDCESISQWQIREAH